MVIISDINKSKMVDKVREQEEAMPILQVSTQEIDKSQSQLASFSTSYVNLVKTIIGAGILVLPSALIQLGLVFGLIMMFVAGGLAILGLHLINVAAMQLDRKASFSGLCSLTYPRAAFAFELAIAVKCIGAGISYLSIVGNTSAGLATQVILPFLSNDTGIFASIIKTKAFWTISFALLITPICLMRKMDSLKYTSFGGLAAVLYLVFLTIWNFFSCPESQGANFTKIPLFPTFSFGMCSAYSVLVFAFTCHQNILPIQNESKVNTPAGMMSIVSSSIGTSTFLYLVVSLFGAATYGQDVNKNILFSFPADQFPFTIARFMYVFLLVLSFPLQVFPCRLCIEKMVGSSVLGSNRLYYGSTLAIITTCAGVGSLAFSVDKGLGWVGATAGTFLCYFLPAIIYNKLYMGTRMDWRRISAIVLFVAGCFTLVLSVIGLISG